MQVLIDALRHHPEIALFLTLAIGFWFGALKFGSFSLGAVTSTLIAGLLIGQLGVALPDIVQTIFFLLFLFAVGYSVGPQFFGALKKDGLPQVAFALIMCAIGLANHVARPRRITDECFIVAAQATADQVDSALRAKGRLYPSQSNILETEVTTATRVAEYMFDKGLAQVERPRDIRAWIEGQLYKPQYED